jgi:hypothetical protein
MKHGEVVIHVPIGYANKARDLLAKTSGVKSERAWQGNPDDPEKWEFRLPEEEWQAGTEADLLTAKIPFERKH